MASLPPTDSYMNQVVKRLRKYDLTKTEVLSLINLGVGLPRPQATEVNGHTEDEMDVEGTDGQAEQSNAEVGGDEAASHEEEAANPAAGPNGRELLSLIVENIEDRFSEEEREEKIDGILNVLKECMTQSNTNGAAMTVKGTVG